MITIHTETFRWEIDETGRSVSFRDAVSGQDVLAWAGCPVAVLRRDDETVEPSGASLDENRLDIVFTDSTRMVLDVDVRRAYAVLTVNELTADPFSRLDFLNVPLSLVPGEDPDVFCACAISRNLRTRVDAVPGPQSELSASCYELLGAEEASVAIAAARFSELRAVLKDVVGDAPELPHSPLGGPWAMDAPENRNSYLFGTATEENVDNWIVLLKDLGIHQLHFSGGAFPCGDYDPNPRLYPRGLNSVKAVVDKLHEAGLQVGLHTLSLFIGKNSRYVTPEPDPRLGYDTVLTLSEDIGPESTAIRVTETVVDMPRYTNYKSRKSMTLMIDGELIDYGAVEEGTNSLTACKRGAYGTQISSHSAGTKAYHLKTCWAMFAPDPDSTLFTEIAANIANLISYADIDMVYLDGLDGAQVMKGEEFRWHYGGRFAFEVYERLRRPIIMEMAAFLHHLWFVRSRMGAWDHPSRGHKHFIDLHHRSNANFHKIFLPGHLGWWAPRVSKGPKDETTYDDDVAYLCTKALADQIGYSLQGVALETCSDVPNLRHVASVFQRYAKVAAAATIPEHIRLQLGQPKSEFELDDSVPSAPKFYPVARHIHHTAMPGDDGTAWEVVNEWSDSSPKIRLEAMWSAGDYDGPNAIPLADFAEDGQFADNEPVYCRLNSGEDYTYPQTAPGMSIGLTVAPGRGLSGGSAGRLIAKRVQSAETIRSSAPDDDFSVLHHGERFHRPQLPSWAFVGKAFEDTLDLTAHQAMGLWVHGDGGGEWLNLQLRSKGRFFSYSDHYIPVDFTGWRYIELIEPESDRFDVCSWPYGRAVYTLHRHGTEYDSVSALHVWVNNMSVGSSADILLSPIQALPIVKNTLYGPVLTINGLAVRFPVEIESGWRLEASGDSGAVFDQKGERIKEFALTEPLPRLVDGSNSVQFECESSCPRPRARVSIVSRAPRPIE